MEFPALSRPNGFILLSHRSAGRLAFRPSYQFAAPSRREESMRTIIHMSAALALCAISAHAQLKAGSLSIKGGETFTVGQKVSVTLVQVKPGTGMRAGKYDFYFSGDGGTSWKEMIGNWQGPTGDNATVTWEWNITQAATMKGVFRACLLSGGECTDSTYTLKSGPFTIAAQGSAVLPTSAAAAGKLDFDAFTGNMALRFSLVAPAHVALRAFNTQGRLLATLLDADQSAGEHALSLFSNRLQEMHGPVAFTLTWGGASLARSLVLP
jgi:hypothetical protein